jgi:hypothetical protein
MLLARLRRRRLLPAFLFGLLLGGGAIPSLWHQAGDDPFCERPLAGAEGAATIGSGPSDTDSEHCEVCHWLRAMRSLALHIADLRLSVPDASRHHVDSFEIPESAPRLSVLARGPPA